MKEEILAEVRPQELPGLMANLRQVQTNTVVVPLGEAPIIRNTRKGAKKKRKQGYVQAAERDTIHAEVVKAKVNEAQAKKKAYSETGGSGPSDGECTSRPQTPAGSPNVHGASRAGTTTNSPPQQGFPASPEHAELPSGLEEVFAEVRTCIYTHMRP
ncbi:hypothetical protein PGTUg99_030770 [Puccinia graminis f. sp. tritici]|uniref:Uncharacterized protein n=1 Tax=Puccinia graminis f. sp. tritici TaxID=56615 RepID=A0A5B0R9R1_PUCGR|nr:hypothetical protein PGTUg99_030770 [Puccinia graminis f. sp. tritici]